MKIKSILIANRGEITIRIIRTARKMNIKTFVIKTSKEPNAWYLDEADEMIDFTENISDTPEFLDIERIIKAAKDLKIDAIHPGYGFLAENPDFAKRCEDEKIIFIGPSSDAIYRMGNKTIAKELARESKVPLLDGSKGTVKDFKEAVKIANKIGYPVILKAAAGGGGRGMRVVEKEKDIERMFKLATNEAEKAFNNSAVFIEKFVREPRHIEFQILGDKHGNIIHLGERECSIQRKHQKLLEESPSPAVDPALRKKMGDAAIRIAKSVDYFSAGTVEFLMDDNKDFHFMEMNTRIQVEHPITEQVTDSDIMADQITVAAGMPIHGESRFPKRYAMECRINAEDPGNDFRPCPGKITTCHFPGGRGVRVDSHVYTGYTIPPNYDSMIAKLIVTATTRERVIMRMKRALEEFVIEGIKSTIPFHLRLMDDETFKSGKFTTSFLDNFDFTGL